MTVKYIACKYRLKPTDEQSLILTDWCNVNRYVWNHLLEANKLKYSIEKKFIYFAEMCLLLTKLKKDCDFIKSPPAHSTQSICKRLETAVKRSYQMRDTCFPVFKSKKRGDLPSIQIPQVGVHIKWTKDTISLPKLGEVKWIKHRPLAGKLISITIKYEGDYWWLIALCETKKLIRPIDDDVVGIDLGLKDWIVTSDGEVFNLHPYLLDREEQAKIEQRKLSKKQKGSNRTKQRKKLQRAYMKVKPARNDNAHKVSAAIAKQYSCVAIEDLNIKGMMKNRNLARKIAQVSWGQLKNYLSYKTNVKSVNRWYPSTKTCSRCGHKQPMPLNVRTYECVSCGFMIDRDLNAAMNIRNVTFGTKGSYAWGDTDTGDEIRSSSRQVSLNQEKFKADGNIFGLEASLPLTTR